MTLPGNPYYPPGFSQREFNSYYSDPVTTIFCPNCNEYWEGDGYTEFWTSLCSACRAAERTCRCCGDEYQQKLPSDHVCERCKNL